MKTFKQFLEQAEIHAFPISRATANRPFKKGDKVALIAPWSGIGPFYMFAEVVTSSPRGFRIKPSHEAGRFYDSFGRSLFDAKTGAEQYNDQRYCIHFDPATENEAWLKALVLKQAKVAYHNRVIEIRKYLNWGEQNPNKLGMVPSAVQDQLRMAEEAAADLNPREFFAIKGH